jgi:thioredoxin-related protein
MKEISETYHNKLTIISISLDNDADWKEAMTKHDMPWVNLRDPKSMGGLAASYGVAGIPNYVLISPEGKVIDKWAGYATGLLKQKVGENIN